jgi:hypothetical protein
MGKAGEGRRGHQYRGDYKAVERGDMNGELIAGAVIALAAFTLGWAVRYDSRQKKPKRPRYEPSRN